MENLIKESGVLGERCVQRAYERLDGDIANELERIDTQGERVADVVMDEDGAVSRVVNAEAWGPTQLDVSTHDGTMHMDHSSAAALACRVNEYTEAQTSAAGEVRATADEPDPPPATVQATADERAEDLMTGL